MCPLTSARSGGQPVAEGQQGANSEGPRNIENGRRTISVRDSSSQGSRKELVWHVPKNGHEGKGGGTDTGELGAVVMRLCSYLNVSALLVQPGG